VRRHFRFVVHCVIFWRRQAMQLLLDRVKHPELLSQVMRQLPARLRLI
jgi:hypothetical protein